MAPPPSDIAAAGNTHSAAAFPTPNSHWIRKLIGFMGPGYLVAIGYIDPGNWATDLAAGSGFGYSLLWVIMLSNLMAILLQGLAIRLGVVTGMDLAQACKTHYSRWSSFIQWIFCEIAICACDLAEVIGTAIALNLLFHIPLTWGILLTILDTVILLALQRKGYRYFEALIISLLAIIFVCIGLTVLLAAPQWADVARGFIPNGTTFQNRDMLYIAIGIIGATVMPHNLYLHSSIVQYRPFQRNATGKKLALHFAFADVVIALFFAFLINASILIISAAVFHAKGYEAVVEIQEAHGLLAPLLGTSLASVLFALALLASGQSSTMTATLAGQIVMEGYLNMKMPAWLRRSMTRGLAILPAFFVTYHFGESGLASLLVFSQVILSLQLPFAVIPLIHFTSDPGRMGEYAIRSRMKAMAYMVAATIISLNAVMVWQFIAA